MADFNLITTGDRVQFEWIDGSVPPHKVTASANLDTLNSDTRVDISFKLDIDQAYDDYETFYGGGKGLRITGSLYSGSVSIGKRFEFQHTGSSFNNLPVYLRYYNTGSQITNPSLKFLVDAPAVDSGATLTFEVHDINVSYLGYSPKFVNLQINTRKKLSDYYYLSFKEKLEIPTFGLSYNQESNLFEFGFITDHEIRFKNQENDVIGGQGVNSRKSIFSFVENFSTYSSSISLLPGNYDAISASFNRNSLKNSEPRFFADIQDSNYSSTPWSRIRYDGSQEDNNGILGEESALTLKSFKGLIFPSSSEKAFLTQFFTSSNVDRVSSDIEDIYYYVVGAGMVKTGSAYFDGTGAIVPEQLQYSYYQDIGNAKISTGVFSRFRTFLLRSSRNSRTGFEKINNAKVVDLEKNWYYLTTNSGSITVPFSNVLP